MNGFEQQTDLVKTRIVLAYIFGNLPEKVQETLREQGRGQRQFCRETEFPRSTLTDILNHRPAMVRPMSCWNRWILLPAWPHWSHAQD